MFNVLMELQYELPLKHIYSHCLMSLNISSENNDFGEKHLTLKSSIGFLIPMKCICNPKKNCPG